jgi:pimeloyl-ACP methyl ester carboxylesterase
VPTAQQQLDQHRSEALTRSGPVSYLDTGGPGRAALFVHGLGTSSYLWRHVITELGGDRRCVAVDLPLHGHTPAAPGQDFSLPGLARFLDDFCEALGLADVDIVANDSGGAITQVLAANYPGRLHTLTLTNCETEGNFPPKALLPAVLAARLGLITRLGPWLIRDTARARKHFFGGGYQDVTCLPDDIVRAWLEPLLATRESAREFQRLFLSLRARDLKAAGPALARLQVPTLLVWGTSDIFFGRKWAYWLRDTIPGATGVTEIDGGRLFFPDERAAELTVALRRHWAAHP